MVKALDPLPVGQGFESSTGHSGEDFHLQVFHNEVWTFINILISTEESWVKNREFVNSFSSIRVSREFELVIKLSYGEYQFCESPKSNPIDQNALHLLKPQ